ncbi:hypothetical protein KCU88_g2935, partial [Aureobasidium melanogenum]
MNSPTPSENKLVVLGGSSSTGIYTIQIAKSLGWSILASCSGRNAEFVKGLGASEVVDYTTSPTAVVDAVKKFAPHAIADCVGGTDCIGLAPQHVTIVGDKTSRSSMGGSALYLTHPRMVARWLLGYVGLGKSYECILFDARKEWLEETTKLHPEKDVIIDSVFEFEKAKEAFERLNTGRARGKVVVEPKSRKISLQGARRGLTKSIVEFAHLKEWELSLIDQEVAARQVALRQASDLSNQRKLLEEGIEKINNSDGAAAAGLRSEAQKVEEEIYQLEARLAELKARHRQLVNRAQEIENSRDSELSSYTESLHLNDEKVRSFLRQPLVGQSLSIAREPGMYALKPDRRTLRMAEDQWTSEVETLNFRKSNVEKEKRALEEGSRLWKSVVHRVVAFEKALRAQMKDLSQSQLGSFGGTDDSITSNGTSAEDASLHAVLSELSALIAFLEEALAEAETHDWKLLICSIGAELAAFQQARDALLHTMGVEDRNFGDSATKDALVQQHDYDTQGDLLSDGPVGTNQMVSHSPAESSNQSLEDTLREFGGATGPDRKNKGDSGLGVESTCPKPEAADDDDLIVRSRTAADQRSESEDDDPGPEFLVSHT